MSASIIITASLSGLLLGQVPAGSSDILGFMKDSSRIYKIVAGEGNARLPLRDEPALRLGRQGSGTILEGANFFWLDEVDGEVGSATWGAARR